MVHFLILSVIVAMPACPPGDPGTVVVIGGDLEPIEFSIQAGIDYQLSYNTSRLALWFNEGQTQPAPPDITFQSPPPQIDHGDMTGDAKVNGADVQLFVDVFLGVETNPDLIEQADFDENDSIDMADVRWFVAALLGQQRTGDMNRDGRVDGNDIQPFVNVLLGAILVPGDLDEDGDVDPGDLALFVNVLLGIESNPDLVDLADLDGDGQSDGGDIQDFVYAILNPTTAPDPNQADLDFSGVVDLADVPLFIEVLLSGVTTPTSTITLFAEGLAPSSDLCDTPVDLLTDPEGDGTFSLAATEGVTVVELTFDPLSGSLGTPVTITMTPAIPPLAFDESTTAQWQGVFQPVVGEPTEAFMIEYSAAQFHESSAGEAVLIIGDGTISNAPDFAALDGLGTLAGVITLHVEDWPLASPLTFAPETDAAKWEQVFYPDGPGGLDPPHINGEAEVINAWLLSLLPDPAPLESSMLLAGGFHHAAVVRVDENADTLASAPDVMSVDLVSYDQTGAELDRVQSVPLNKVPGDDGDPANIVYHNDLSKPIIPVDVDLDKDDYPNVFLLKIEVGGTVVIVPATD